MAKKSFVRKVFTSLFILLMLLGGISAWFIYQNLIKSNVELGEQKSVFFYVKSNFTYEDLLAELERKHFIKNLASFDFLARKMNLDQEFKPGKYRITSKMSNRQIIKMIKSGKQEKVMLSFNYNDRTTAQLIDKISSKLEIEKSELEDFFSNETKLQQLGFNPETIRCLFIPKTYELNWNTTLSELVERLLKRYHEVWNSNRKLKASKMNYSEAEVMTLASIVQCESGIKSEQAKIAGVYLNRLKKDMLLQADPTLLFATGNFGVQRVLNSDKKIESPYNTYKYKGLPPGPICLPYVQSIDAVLNHNRHNYVFFCAKPDLSGYSNYSVTYQEHKKYADVYQQEMDRRGIKR